MWAPFSAKRLGQQELACIGGLDENRGVKLHELHVGEGDPFLGTDAVDIGADGPGVGIVGVEGTDPPLAMSTWSA